jgi:hypothetical protein
VKCSRDYVFTAIDTEREYQRQRWGAGGEAHSPLEYLAYVQDYVNEAMHRLSRESDAEALKATQDSLRKIAALAVCALELHGVNMRSLP